MKESGLVQPLAVKDNGDGTYRLLAGGRRVAVLKKNGVAKVPVRIYSSGISDLEMKVIEKAENFYRKDMEWWELDKLTADIHKLQQQLHGAKSSGPTSTGWGTRDTASLIGAKSPASVTEAIKRHEAREAFPELFAKCKTASEASKVVKKISENLVKEAIAEKVAKSSEGGVVEKLSKAYIVGDFFEHIKEIPSEVYHLVEIDPPYGIDLKNVKQHYGESHYTKDEYNEVGQNDYPAFISNVLKECYRVMLPNSWLILWFGPEPWISTVHEAILNAGFKTTYLLGIWIKSNSQTNHPDIKLGNNYETFFYAWKGRPVLAKPGTSNVFDFPSIPASKKTHPTEKPIELMKSLYETFAFPGSRILIPFLGSGNGLVAAHEVQMSAVGYDLSKQYKDSFLVKLANYARSFKI